jgi:hypothetical protein
MKGQILLAIISLIDRQISANKALGALKEAAKNAHENGRELTLDDLKSFQVADDGARDMLVQAIEDAEK